MKKTLGYILIGFGFFMFLVASSVAQREKEPAGQVGAFLPGFLCLIVGLVLCQGKTRPAAGRSAPGAPPAENGAGLFLNRLKSRAELGVIGGIVMMFTSGAFTRQGPAFLLVGLAFCLGGWALLIWGCVNYARWKGYSGWLGLLGCLVLPGIIILACFPNRNKRTLPLREVELIPIGKGPGAADPPGQAGS